MERQRACLAVVNRVRNQSMKQGILLAAFGAGSPHSESTLKLFDLEVRRRFPGIPVRWAFTSVLVRERLAAARVKRDSVRKALQKMWFEKYTHVAVQPLQTIPGNEYAEVQKDVRDMEGPQGFAMARAGAPLLASAADVQRVAAAIVRHLPEGRTADEPVVLMGHGAKHAAVARYEELAEAVRTLDRGVHVGTMSGAVTLEHILPLLPSGGKVWLMPLLSVIGRHALCDMAGRAPHSWRSRIESRGCLCEAVLKGTAEYAAFVEIWLDHLEETINSITMGESCVL